MNPRSIILLSKDAMGKFYLPTYGNKYWKTPNIDELAAKGTVFHRHYTTAPSTAMAVFSMFTGKYPYETNRKDYIPITNPEPYETFFDKMYERGYDCHIIWDEKWMSLAKPYSECYGEHVTFDSIPGIRQPVGTHEQHEHAVPRNDKIASDTTHRIEEKLCEVTMSDRPVFLWMHLPHVHLGRDGYGSDIDLFDEMVGIVRKYFRDENIFITADHGNMNGTHNKIGYGFDVYEAAIATPLITPRLQGEPRINYPTTNRDLFEIIVNRTVPRHEFVYSDSAYYGQLHRKLAIISGKYKYIFNKRTHTEELYDVVFDPEETVNLISDRKYDTDRHASCLTQDLYFYDSWSELPEVRTRMRTEKERIWRDCTIWENLHARYLHIGKTIWRFVRNKFHINYSIHC